MSVNAESIDYQNILTKLEKLLADVTGLTPEQALIAVIEGVIKFVVANNIPYDVVAPLLTSALMAIPGSPATLEDVYAHERPGYGPEPCDSDRAPDPWSPPRA